MLVSSASDYVSLSRNIIGLLTELRSLVSLVYKEERRYAKLIDSKIDEQNELFWKISNEYRAVVNELLDYIESSDGGIYTEEFKSIRSKRDQIVFERQALIGSMEGVENLIENFSPYNIRLLLTDYFKYAYNVQNFFFWGYPCSAFAVLLEEAENKRQESLSPYRGERRLGMFNQSAKNVAASYEVVKGRVGGLLI